MLMKKLCYISLLFVAIFIMLSNAASSQIVVEYNPMKNLGKNSFFMPKINPSKLLKTDLGNGGFLYKSARKQPSQQDGKQCKVTCIVEDDSLKYYTPFGIYITGPTDGSFSTDVYSTSDNPNFFECEVPAGTYDIVSSVLCKGSKESSTAGMAIVIKELVNISTDTTIYIHHADATNAYHIKTTKPNGDELVLDNYNLDENYMIKDTVVKGNVKFINDDIFLHLKNNGYVFHFFCSDVVIFNGGEEPTTIYLNNVSDRYKFIDIRSCIDEDGSLFVCRNENTTMSDHVIKSTSGSKYINYQEKFTPSLSRNLDNESLLAGFSFETAINFINDGGGMYDPIFKAVDGITQVYIDAPMSTDEHARYDVLVSPVLADAKNQVVNEFTWKDEDGVTHTERDTSFVYSATSGLPVIINGKGELEYVNASHDEGGNFSFHVPEGGGPVVEYPGHPRFSYSPSQKKLSYGSSCPINAFMAQNTDKHFTPGKHSALNCCYIGRYGEVRNGDLLALTSEIKYNDSIICNDYGKLDETMYNFANEGHPDGVITAHFVNKNMMVDGLQGKNVTDINYDQRKQDWTAPTLQMLLFKDQEGNIVDRFSRPEEGTLEFAGGDFNFHVVDNNYWFDCKPQVVEVSYSPYNEGKWNTLEVAEVPESFYMPGFGYFYRGSLSGVTGKGEKGWFDLKIKLTDLSGNWQEQVISPAFRVDSMQLTAVGEVTDEASVTEVARYTLDGRTIAEPQRGVNIVKYSDGTVRKVLVK